MTRNKQTEQKLSIAILAYPNAQISAIYGLIDLFETAVRLAKQSGQEYQLSIERLTQVPDSGQYQVTIIPPSMHELGITSEQTDFVPWLLQQHQQGSLLCSVCAGAFLLAETGLLNHRPATTHWALGDDFHNKYPDVQLNVDKLVIDDGDIITAGGLMAWLDLGLKLIDRFFTTSAMLATARYFLVDPGGREQRFYSTFAPVLSHGDDKILKVQHWLQLHSAEAIYIPKLAAMAGLGERTFLRRFVKATKLKPLEYLQHLRIGKAKDLIETSSLNIDEIAWQVGYQDPSAFRRTFHKTIGLTPREYRQRFSFSAN